jgi:ATP-binding cassette subfamily C (CFTR/MRP) protein 4
MSNDVNRFDYSANFFVYLWVGPLQTLVISYLMWREIGFAAIIGVATVMLVIPLQGAYVKKMLVIELKITVVTVQPSLGNYVLFR